MGGLFSAPSPPPPPPLPTADDSAAQEDERRREAIARKRRGRRGTIATSPRGLLSLNDVSAQRLSLLGE